MKSVLLIFLVSLATLGSQLLLKKGVGGLAASGPPGANLPFLVRAFLSPYVISALVLQAMGYIIWIMVISRVKLGYAFAVSGGFFYILLAAAGWLLFNEALSFLQWLGILLITTGVILMNIGPA